MKIRIRKDPGLAIKNPPNKTQKNPPKNPLQSGFFGVFKNDVYFWCKSHYFSCKMSLEEF
jgi:hypothetical protein